MDPNLMILIVGLSYALVFSLMAMLRREGLSSQFLLEVLLLTALIAGGGTLSGSTAHPILFLVFLYLLTMRARLLTDLGMLLSNRGRQRDAIRAMQVALRLLPDPPTRLIVLLSMGVVQLRRQNPASAQELLQMSLETGQAGGLSLRNRAAAHYHLGLAVQRQGKDAQAVHHFHQAVESFPGSPYGREAERALEQRRQSLKPKQKPPGAGEA